MISQKKETPKKLYYQQTKRKTYKRKKEDHDKYLTENVTKTCKKHYHTQNR